MSGQALNELDRRLANVVRLGTIAEVDPATGMAKVDLGDMTTDWLPWATTRAGQDRTWSTPDEGEQVMVFAPSGELAQAVVGPSLFQQAHAQNGNDGKDRRTTFKDGTVIEFDRDGSVLNVNVNPAGSINLIIGSTNLKLENGKATLTTPEFLVDSPTSTFTGQVTVQGLLTYLAGMVGSGGTGATAAIEGNVIVTGGDVKADAISLKQHKTSGVTPGGGTSNVPVP